MVMKGGGAAVEDLLGDVGDLLGGGGVVALHNHCPEDYDDLEIE